MLCMMLCVVDWIVLKLCDVIEVCGWNMLLFVQGDVSCIELFDCFCVYGNVILVGSQSFWEGVDVCGDVLLLVVIDKLLFVLLDDLVLVVWFDVLMKKGLSLFVVYQLLQVVIMLKQGVGWLICVEMDCGVLMICDM